MVEASARSSYEAKPPRHGYSLTGLARAQEGKSLLGSLCVGHVGQTDTARALCVRASLGSLCCTWSLGVSAVEVGVFRCPQQSHLAHMFPLPKHLRSPGLEDLSDPTSQS